MRNGELGMRNVVSLHCDSERVSHTDSTDLTDSLRCKQREFSFGHSMEELQRSQNPRDLRDYFFFLALASFMVMILPGCSGSRTAAPPCLKKSHRMMRRAMAERTPTNINMSNNIFILFLMLNVKC